MPGRDKTGPMGAGPRTGRGAGDCGTTERQLDSRRKGLGPCGDGTPRGGGMGRGTGRMMGRRRDKSGITYFT
jgi:hypothetical protein